MIKVIGISLGNKNNSSCIDHFTIELKLWHPTPAVVCKEEDELIGLPFKKSVLSSVNVIPFQILSSVLVT